MSLNTLPKRLFETVYISLSIAQQIGLFGQISKLYLLPCLNSAPWTVDRGTKVVGLVEAVCVSVLWFRKCRSVRSNAIAVD